MGDMVYLHALNPVFDYAVAYATLLAKARQHGSGGDTFAYAMATLCLGNPAGARDIMAFERGLDMAKPPQQGGGGMIAADYAGVLWLNGQPDKAFEVLMFVTNGLLNGRIRYADPSGGCAWGLLLWYFANVAGREDLRAHSIKYLKKRAKLKKADGIIGYGPVARYVLAPASEAAFLESVLGCTELPGISDRARKGDGQTRAGAVRALFYVAEVYRQSGNERNQMQFLRACADIENPHYTPEWYLARHVLGMNYDWRTDH
jgi:hypothetical protein